MEQDLLTLIFNLINQYGFSIVLSVVLLFVFIKDYFQQQREEIKRLEIMSELSNKTIKILKEMAKYHEACFQSIISTLDNIDKKLGNK